VAVIALNAPVALGPSWLQIAGTGMNVSVGAADAYVRRLVGVINLR